MKRELIALFEYWEKERGIEKSYLIDSLEKGLLSVYRKKAGLPKNIKIKIIPESGDIKFINEKGEEVPPPTFPWERIAAQTAKQVIIQKIREAEKNTVYQEFKDMEGEVVSGRVERFENENVVINVGKTEALLPHHHKLQSDHFKVGDPVKSYLLEVRKPNRGNYQLILSRTHPNFVRKLLEREVPEIEEGIIEIKAIARFPGDLTKIGVYSRNEKVDPVGTCIGDKASRIKNITKELRGEKIEIIPWSPDIAEFIKNSLSPAKCEKVILNEEKKESVAIVSDDQIFLAIGKRGQNVRLASKLTGWNIKVYRESEYTGEAKPAVSVIEGIDEKLAKKLAEFGYSSIKSLAEAKVEQLTKIPDIEEKTVLELIEKAKNYLKRESEKK